MSATSIFRNTPAEVPATTAEGQLAAGALWRTNWDAAVTIDIAVPKAAAEALLTARGWTRGLRREWVSPSGVEKFPYWDTDDALRTALLAELDCEPIVETFRRAR